ncbi:unnamed protein product [Orchesella dallaii]|uniref:Uncharacterized protein n=1 Tax=Orchesella dallaii TaxID=48710 RepID=A0ABP1PKS0_9HEXA
METPSMVETIKYATWSQTENLLFNHFGSTSIQFVWENGTELTNTVFCRCIILQCIIINYNAFGLEEDFLNRSKVADEEIIRTKVYCGIFYNNSKLITIQRFSTKDLLLVSDSKFPTSHWENRILQTLILGPDAQHFNTYPITPFTIPTAILFTLNSIKISVAESRVELSFGSTLLIFGNLRKNSVRISCFACKYLIRMPIYNPDSNRGSTRVGKISFIKIPKYALISLKTLIHFWGYLNMQYQLKGEVCDAAREYFKRVNITDNGNFLYFTSARHLSRIAFTNRKFDYLTQVLPYGQNQVEFFVQIMFFQQKYFDTQLLAFLTPFTIKIWVCTLVAIATVSVWLICNEGIRVDEAIFWQISLLLDQGVYEIRHTRISGKLVIVLWLFSAILLTEFYNSSLYSFMAAEKEQNNFPKSMEETVNNKEYDIILPDSFYDELYFVFAGDNAQVPKKLAKLYLRILEKAFLLQPREVNDEFLSITIQNAVQGINTKGSYFPKSRFKPNITLAEFANNYFPDNIERKFSQFAVVCSQDCTEGWTAPLLQQNRLLRVIPKQSAFFNYFQFWSRDRSFYTTIHFPKFLKIFVESGLYDSSIKRFSMLRHLMSLKLNSYRQNLRISDGRLYSYVVFGDKNSRLMEVQEDDPAKISSFIGVFLLSGSIICVSLLVLIIEFCKPAFYP